MNRLSARKIRPALILIAVWFLQSCSLMQQSPRPHPLNNTFQTVQGGIAESEVFRRAMQADVVILAEKHDNRYHHGLQQKLLKALVEHGRRPALGMEMFSRDQTSLLMQYIDPPVHGKPMTEEALRRALNMEEDGLPWQQYAPLFRQLKASGSPAFGIDLPVALRARLGALGEDKLLPVERRQLPETEDADPLYRKVMFERIRASHCGWGPEPYLRKLFRVWQARNQTMAEQIAAMLETDRRPVVVIVGNGHTDYNLGLISRLKSLRPDVSILNMGLLETETDKPHAEAYLFDSRFPERPRYDVVYLAPPETVPEDLCAAFNQRRITKP